MLYSMLGYPEVITNLIFAPITTMPLELRAGIRVDSDTVDVLEDGAFIGSAVDSFRRSLDMDEWRQHTANQVLVLDDLKLSKLSVDKITQFSLRPPEFLKVFDKVGEYYRWFSISKTKIKVDMLPEKIVSVLSESCWIDGLQRQIRVRKEAMSEILLWCDEIQRDGGNRYNLDMISLFLRIDRALASENEPNLSDEEIEFREFMHANLLHHDEKEEHLPIPIYSYLKPTMGVSFILHVMLSMGRFETEIDLIMHRSIRECLRYCGLIGERNDEESLTEYANTLTREFIIEQVQYYPCSQRVIDFYIITAVDLFNKIIVKDELPVSDMPPVQLSTLLASKEEEVIMFQEEIKSNVVDAGLKEVELAVDACNIPTKEEMMGATVSDPLDWDAITLHSKFANQSEESYEEQHLAIQTCIGAIDSYRLTLFQDTYTKNVGIRGFPGGGKTWCMIYCALYAVSKGLRVITTSMMSKRSLQLGGSH